MAIDPSILPDSKNDTVLLEGFVYESIRARTLQPMQPYRITEILSTSGSVSARKHARKAYTESEDAAIVTYVLNMQDKFAVSGNMLWKQAAADQVTTHSWQSMKERFRKFLREKADVQIAANNSSTAPKPSHVSRYGRVSKNMEEAEEEKGQKESSRQQAKEKAILENENGNENAANESKKRSRVEMESDEDVSDPELEEALLAMSNAQEKNKEKSPKLTKGTGVAATASGSRGSELGSEQQKLADCIGLLQKRHHVSKNVAVFALFVTGSIQGADRYLQDPQHAASFEVQADEIILKGTPKNIEVLAKKIGSESVKKRIKFWKDYTA